MMQRFVEFCKTLPQYATRGWYPYAVGITSLVDYFIFIIPIDAIVIGSIVAARKRWFSVSFWASLGSAAGAAAFAAVVQHFGISILEKYAPHILNDQFAVTISHWLSHYGFWALIGLAATPIHPHPTVTLAALANMSILTIFLSMFIGRLLKYTAYTFLSDKIKTGWEKYFRN